MSRIAAERFGALLGTEHEGMAAAEFLAALAAEDEGWDDVDCDERKA